MTKPDLKLIEGGLGHQPAVEPHVPEPHEQGEMPFAVVDGEPVTQMPKDLYIPPDALQVFLEAFEGPLDLLLYLIRRQNLDILDIPVAEITRQYIDYINVMQEMRFELAAEYLLMAAILAEIKSRLLLPRPPREDGTEEDPRADLVRRLATDLHRVIRAPDIQPRWAGIGVTPLGGTAEEAAKRNAVETERWSKVIKAADIRAQ